MMNERQFTETVERAERALAEGDFHIWRDAMDVIAAGASDEQWARAVHWIKSSRRSAPGGLAREEGGPEGPAAGESAAAPRAYAPPLGKPVSMPA